MGRLLCSFLCVLLLAGCAVREPAPKEYVRDSLPAAMAREAPHTIDITVPSDAIEVSSQANQAVYRAKEGVYSIETEAFVTDSLDAAVYHIAGAQKTRIWVELERDDGQECQFAWVDGTRVCRAKAVLIGDYCYCLCFRLEQGLGSDYQACINAVFASFCLLRAESDNA